MSSSDGVHKRSSQALKSTLQGMYEHLILAFGESVETLNRLQVESAARQQGKAPEPAANAPAASMSHAELERRIAALAGQLYTPQDLEEAVEQVIGKQGVPSQAQFLAIVEELELLSQAVDERIAALRNTKTSAAQPANSTQPN